MGSAPMGDRRPITHAKWQTELSIFHMECGAQSRGAAVCPKSKGAEGHRGQCSLQFQGGIVHSFSPATSPGGGDTSLYLWPVGE